jgi:GMP reductase
MNAMVLLVVQYAYYAELINFQQALENFWSLFYGLNMKILPDIKFDFDDVLIRPQRSTLDSRSKVIINRDFTFYHSPRHWSGTPIMCSNMKSIASFKMAKEFIKHKMITCLHKYHDSRNIIDFFQNEPEALDYTWLTIGGNNLSKDNKDLYVLDLLRKESIYPNLVIDCANGHMQEFVSFCKRIRELNPDSIIMAGNVCIPECVSELIIHGGVDICKIQIGPSPVCKTRMITGVGYGTISCIDECGAIAHGLKSKERCLGLVCSDGGIKNPGDLCKAFVAGADFVMIGTMFAGTDECTEEWHETNGKKYMKHYGMSTHYIQNELGLEQKDYRASEGKVLTVENKGPISNILRECLGGIRSCCTMIGATSIKDMSKCGQFIQVRKIHSNYSNSFGD